MSFHAIEGFFFEKRAIEDLNMNVELILSNISCVYCLFYDLVTCCMYGLTGVSCVYQHTLIRQALNDCFPNKNT